MKRRAVVFEPDARIDLANLYGWIADASSPVMAERYVRRVGDFIRRLDLASERGTARDDLGAGLRLVGFERRLTIAFRVTDREVRILAVFRAGQDWASTLSGH